MEKDKDTKRAFDLYDIVLIILTFIPIIILVIILLIFYRRGIYIFSSDYLGPPDYLDTFPAFSNLTYKKDEI